MLIWPQTELSFTIAAATVESEPLMPIQHLEEEPSPVLPPSEQTLELEHH
jgi:hypothetical protein